MLTTNLYRLVKDTFKYGLVIIILSGFLLGGIMLATEFNQPYSSRVAALDTLRLCDNFDQDEVSDTNNPADSAVCKDRGSEDIITGNNGLVRKITNWAAIFAGIIAVIMIIVAGAKMVMAGGDANAVAAARTKLFHAVIGLIIIAFAQVIISFAITTFFE